MSHDASHRYEWNAIPWRQLEVRVFKLQRRIYQATTRGEVQKAHRLQKLLASSWSAKSLAVRRVTQENTGKKTAGVDGMKNLTPQKRPLGIPIMHDRATQALVKLALEPEWEAKFEPNSFGFRPGRSCQDAIQQIFLTICHQPRYVLDADIASCFDRIDQAALLEKMNTSPHFARPIKEWLKAGVVDSGIFMPTDRGTPQGGVLTPPTKLQTFFFEVRIARVRIDSKDDIDLVLGYVDPLHEGPDEVPFVRPIRSLQAVVDVGRKVFQTANDQLQFCVHGRLICQLLALLLQPGDTLAQAGQPGLKFGLVDEPLRVTVNLACDPLPQLADLRFDRRKRRALCAGLRLQAAPIFLRQALRVGQQRTDVLPDGQVQPIRPDLGMLTDALATKAIRIGPQAAGIRVRAGLALPGPRADAFAIIGIATLLALHQTLQEI